jgi:Protein of unknown function (DUF3833)
VQALGYSPNLTPALARRRFSALAATGLVAGALGLSGCSSGPTVNDYAAEKPVLDLKTYFNGKLRAHGMFSDRAGRIVKRFVVEMDCRWTGEDGVLDEQFTYADGTKERRVWRLKHLGGGRYTGRADDVLGEAVGASAGNAFQWRYTLKLPVDGRVWEVDFDDWMVLIDERVMLNRAVMSKFGIRLGEVQLVFTK